MGVGGGGGERESIGYPAICNRLLYRSAWVPMHACVPICVPTAFLGRIFSSGLPYLGTENWRKENQPLSVCAVVFHYVGIPKENLPWERIWMGILFQGLFVTCVRLIKFAVSQPGVRLMSQGWSSLKHWHHICRVGLSTFMALGSKYQLMFTGLQAVNQKLIKTGHMDILKEV